MRKLSFQVNKERYYRLFWTYIKREGVKKLWRYPGYLNERRLHSPESLLNGYFLDFSRDADYEGPHDDQGVPLINYGGAIGVKYNPWAIGHYGLACFDRYVLSGQNVYLRKFFVSANWFLKSVSFDKGCAVWYYDFSLADSSSDLWISALAQSYAISVLLRAFLLTNENKFLEIAKKAFTAFTLPVEEGGVQTKNAEGHIFLEEDSSLQIPRILNGFIFALFGVFEYRVVTESPEAKDLWEKGVDALKNYLPEFDIGYFSLYNLFFDHRKNIASLFYHLVHIRQLEVLYFLSKEEIFQKFAVRWKEYYHNPRFRTIAVLRKIMFKLNNF